VLALLQEDPRHRGFSRRLASAIGWPTGDGAVRGPYALRRASWVCITLRRGRDAELQVSNPDYSWEL